MPVTHIHIHAPTDDYGVPGMQKGVHHASEVKMHLNTAGWAGSRTFGRSNAPGHSITVRPDTGEWKHTNATGREVAKGVGVAHLKPHLEKIGLNKR